MDILKELLILREHPEHAWLFQEGLNLPVFFDLAHYFQQLFSFVIDEVNGLPLAVFAGKVSDP